MSENKKLKKDFTLTLQNKGDISLSFWQFLSGFDKMLMEEYDFFDK